MKAIIIGLIGSVVLSSCSQTIGDINTGLQKSAPEICKIINTGYLTFTTFANTSGTVKQSLINHVNEAYNVAKPFCENPKSLTASQVLVLTAQQVAILAAIRDAKK